MGCLLGCFGRRKNRRRQKRRESFQPRLNRISEGSTKNVHLNVKEVPKVSEDSANDVYLNLRVPSAEKVPNFSEDSAKVVHLDVRVPTVEEIPKVSVIPIADICNKAEEEEKHSPSPTRKRVTFDSKVKTYEHIVVEESIELFEEKKEEVKPEEKPLKCSSEGSDITSNSSGSSYPSNHRYQNCRESDDDEEEDVTDCDESDLDDEEDDGGLLREDYYDDDDNSYNDKLQNWDDEVYTEEIADNVLDIEKTRGSSNASARDRSGYVNAVLNPIENLSQWKAVKSNGRTIQRQPRKENVNASFTLEEPRVDDELSSFNFKSKSRDETKKQRTQELAVDASLSTWLSTSQTTTSGYNNVSTMSEKKIHTSSYSKAVQSHDERPILCALTSEEIKQFSAKNSPRKSPSRSPESPIIGTVGGYWNSQSMATSKYREV